ncbi:hypothetical protein N866_19000 [Actinotalea ferrariae CF5-4]|uniref:Uncharacterized protein n=1 Tax=Actinotalea ferrariae CF5-4 TaxID=948458 RepID=A0A021VRB9_9CELL|nr:hypothetical protein N866_19000 [Actinotalea ferrariae CF5-4]
MDGPVVTAARRALDADDVNLLLPYVHADGEDEVREVFALVRTVRHEGTTAREVADRLLFETVVRVHRAGEGAPFTGLKPAGLDVGPAIPLAEQALADGDAAELVELLTGAVRSEAERRLGLALAAADEAATGVPQARRWVEAMLGLQVWAHGVHKAVHGGGHGGHDTDHEHPDEHEPATPDRGPAALLRDHPE